MFWGCVFLNWHEKYLNISLKLANQLHGKDSFFIEGLMNGLFSRAYFLPSEEDHNVPNLLKKAKWIETKILISGKSLHFRKKKIVRKEIGSIAHLVSWKVSWKWKLNMKVVMPSLWEDFVTWSPCEYC